MQVVQQADGGGYNVVYGGRTVSDLSVYPAHTNAAGAFQIAPGTYQQEAARLGLSGFSPGTQQLIFADLAINSGAVAALQAGNLTGAITDLSHVWAAVPLGAGPNDHSYYTFSSTADSHVAGQSQPSMAFDTFVSTYHQILGH